MENSVKTNENGLAKINDLPNLHEAEVSQRELSSDYWTPEDKGEYKVGVILGVKEEPYVDEATGESVMLPCIKMLAQEVDGTFSTVRNGSKRLVATIENAIESGEIVFEKTPVKVEYLGKSKNKTNAFKSDRWSVKPIIF